MALKLDIDSDDGEDLTPIVGDNELANSASCEIDSEGIRLRLNRGGEEIKVSKTGIMNILTGEFVGLLNPAELEFQEFLGQGASGYVQKATHRPSNTPLAIKSINVYDKHKRHQLINDLSALHSGECDQLVKLYGAYYDEGSVKVALELMDIGSLGIILKLVERYKPNQQPSIPESVLFKMTQQILSGLAFLHKVRHQVHRDIKPDNILINSNGCVKLTDFGISKELEETISLCKTFVGTKSHMSPERMEGEKYSFPSDIWSLGLVLIEMATGQYPYPTGLNFVEIQQIVKSAPSPNLPNNGVFSIEMRDFISHCLHKKPVDRWSALQLLSHPWITKYNELDSDIYYWMKEMAHLKQRDFEEKMSKKKERIEMTGLTSLVGLNANKLPMR